MRGNAFGTLCVPKRQRLQLAARLKGATDMNARQEVMNLIGELSESQIKKVIDCIRTIRKEKKETGLTGEQKELLSLLNCTINTGRGDFAEKHDRYIYGEK